ncbi:YkvA family protein [Tepidibacter sp. Z1-5]|uniref:YkvA family protein n=1 Tax=Tepidibacter sp. Z1-5 TaxID=3134138 RepID=UPI0030C52994
MINPSQVAKDILSSEYFKNARKNAQIYSNDINKIEEILLQVDYKLNNMKFNENEEKVVELVSNMKNLYRLVKVYYSDEYEDINIESIVWAIVAINYFISPVDFIPDSMENVGYIDDMIVVYFVLSNIKSELDEFLIWEKNKENIFAL